LSELTKDCRYDRLSKPPSDGPLEIRFHIDIKHIEASDHRQFKMHMLVQMAFVDLRLKFDHLAPQRQAIIGENKLRSNIWIPHFAIYNDRDTRIMGFDDKDVFVAITPFGEVQYTFRVTALIYCWMNLHKFPFDDQSCDLNFKSWTYNASHLLLKWYEPKPVIIAPQLHLTEFRLVNYWTKETMINAGIASAAFGKVGNYSNLVFEFHVVREIGYYFLDYFIPSMMLVCVSWVSFWLHPDASPPRITLGTSTMLSFITLQTGQTKTLPKVSYIKASEIWFLGCVFFIFLSMAEFAFVNVIWRRKKKVPLKKQSSKYILQSAITPKFARRELQKSSSMSSVNSFHKSHSCSSLEIANQQERNSLGTDNYLTVQSNHSLNLPKIITQSDEELTDPRGHVVDYNSVRIPENSTELPNSWTTMTPQEVAIWIDRKSRFFFPISFTLFNVFYWTFVYML